MRKIKQFLIHILVFALLLNQSVIDLHAAAGTTDKQTTAANVTKVTDYANQLKNSTKVNVTTGAMTWDTEKKPYSWAYFNGLMLDAYMMLDPNNNASYVEGFYSANINSNGKIVNLEAGKPEKGALDNIEPMRAAFDVISGKQSAKIKAGIQEMYSQLEDMIVYTNCGGNYVHKQENGTVASSWAEYPIALDGLYMAQPFLLECANAIDRGALTLKDKKGNSVTSASLYNAVYNRFVWIYNNLYNSSTGLFDHGYNPTTRQTNGITWTRSVGWYAMALVDVIEMMPAGDRKSTLISELPRLFDGMMRYQDQNTGLWYNVTAYDSSLSDYSGNKLETSGTAMMSYAMFKAYKNGWVTGKKYAESGLKGFNGIVANKMTGSKGNYSVIDTYRSSGASTDPSYYTKAPYTTNEAKGVGPLIMAATMANEVATKLENQIVEESQSSESGSDSGQGGSGDSGSGSGSDSGQGGSGDSGSGSGSDSGQGGSGDSGSGSDSGQGGSGDSGSGSDSGQGGSGDSGSGSGSDSGQGGSGDSGSGSGEEPGSGDYGGSVIDDPLIITIRDVNDTAADTYEAYQIFTGVLSDGSSIDQTVAWGNGVITENGSISIGEKTYTAYELVRAYTLGEISVNDLLLALENHLSTAVINGQNYEGSPDVYIQVPAPGYYLIRNTAGSAADGEAYTKFILRVVGSESILVDAKTDAPSVDKKVKNSGEEDSSFRDANNGKVDDLINYKITSNIPNMAEYEQYDFTLQDLLSSGLTYQENSLKITIGEVPLQSGNDYTANIEKKENGETAISIIFHNFIRYKGQTGSKIIVTYDARINEDAVTGAQGNPNSVYLTYSNDPNHTDGRGKTPTKWVMTYLACLKAFKYNGKDATALSGAKFTLTGEQLHSYSTDETGGLQPTRVEKIVMSGTDGYVDFGTLGAGSYQITEIQAPDGYNLLHEAIDVEITCDSDEKHIFDEHDTATWTVLVNGEPITNSYKNELIEITVDSSVFLFGIKNQAGALLPSTGGPGTGGIYLLGFGLIMAAIFLKRQLHNQ